MKKKINFEKRIDFPTMIGEISAISLEKNLSFISDTSVEGNLILSGKYKLTEATTLEEDFTYNIPIEIELTEHLDPETSSIDITNFTYTIQDENIMICNIELTIDGLELLEERECDGEEKEEEIPHIEETPNIEETNTIPQTIFNIDKKEESYGTLLVYIVREEDSINNIITKYNTSLEELEKYNDIKSIKAGTKLIIPIVNEE